MDLPGWNRLQVSFKAGKASAVHVWHFHRLGRTGKGLTALFDHLANRKVNLMILREGINLTTPAGRMIANVIVSMAQCEAEIRAERTIAGRAAACQRGKYLSR